METHHTLCKNSGNITRGDTSSSSLLFLCHLPLSVSVCHLHGLLTSPELSFTVRSSLPLSLPDTYSLENKGSLLASMVPWRTLNIHGTFPFHKKFFIVEKKVLYIIKMFFTLRNKWFFEELFTERFFEEPKMVLLWHCCENPLLEPVFLWLQRGLQAQKNKTCFPKAVIQARKYY